jgi:hypothetical protein
MSLDVAWITARIEKTKALIVAYEDAILALAGGAQSYSFDDGQGKVVKTAADLGSMRLALSELEDRLGAYNSRLCGNVIVGMPGY